MSGDFTNVFHQVSALDGTVKYEPEEMARYLMWMGFNDASGK